MSATIIAFPGTAPCRAAAPRIDLGSSATQVPQLISAASLATKFTDHFLPIVQASIDLLEASEADFEARCRRMLDADGTTMINDLYSEMEIVSRQMKVLVDGLELTRTRLRTAMTRLLVAEDTG